MATSPKKRLAVDTNERWAPAEGRDFAQDCQEARRAWRGGPLPPFTRSARRLIPGAELNDGLILTEGASGQMPLLVNSDKPLWDMDRNAFAVISFPEADLPLVNLRQPQRR